MGMKHFPLQVLLHTAGSTLFKSIFCILVMEIKVLKYLFYQLIGNKTNNVPAWPVGLTHKAVIM
jgi:hypothetical protein